MPTSAATATWPAWRPFSPGVPQALAKGEVKGVEVAGHHGQYCGQRPHAQSGAAPGARDEGNQVKPGRECGREREREERGQREVEAHFRRGPGQRGERRRQRVAEV